MRIVFAAAFFVLLLGACGIKGPLFMPHVDSVPSESTEDAAPPPEQPDSDGGEG
ncbi:MAG: lipoprotein [Azoarcus sp.]|jgi:predicted small lipoprotein YifL|nr:lipoprotein [Azoarcus sp.]